MGYEAHRQLSVVGMGHVYYETMERCKGSICEQDVTRSATGINRLAAVGAAAPRFHEYLSCPSEFSIALRHISIF